MSKEFLLVTSVVMKKKTKNKKRRKGRMFLENLVLFIPFFSHIFGSKRGENKLLPFLCVHQDFPLGEKNNKLSINPEESAVFYGLNEATHSEIQPCSWYVREQLLHYSCKQ